MNGYINLGECKWFLESDYCMDALSYFLTQYKGKLNSRKEKDTGIVFEASLEYISTNTFSTFVKLLTVHKYPVTELSVRSYAMKHMKLLSKIMHNNTTLTVLNLLGFCHQSLMYYSGLNISIFYFCKN